VRIAPKARLVRALLKGPAHVDPFNEVTMRTAFTIVAPVIAFMAAGCAASFPPPTQRMADAESAERSAKEVGADQNPAAKLEVKLADEQIAAAKVLIANGENERADFVLIRARADAELALALAREQNANVEVTKAVEKSSTTFNANQMGAKP
jgi:hypothetical protein